MSYSFSVNNSGSSLELRCDESVLGYATAQLLRAYSPAVRYRNQKGMIVLFPNTLASTAIVKIKVRNEQYDSGIEIIFNDKHKAIYNWQLLEDLVRNKKHYFSYFQDNLMLQEQNKIQLHS